MRLFIPSFFTTDVFSALVYHYTLVSGISFGLKVYQVEKSVIAVILFFLWITYFIFCSGWHGMWRVVRCSMCVVLCLMVRNWN